MSDTPGAADKTWLCQAAEKEATTFLACLESERDRFHKQVRPTSKLTIKTNPSAACGTLLFEGRTASFQLNQQVMSIQRVGDAVELRQFEFCIEPQQGYSHSIVRLDEMDNSTETKNDLYTPYWRSLQTGKKMTSAELAFFCIGRICGIK